MEDIDLFCDDMFKSINKFNNDVCPICLCNENLDLVITACNHIFHRECIVKSTKKGKDSCPYCRNDLYNL